MEEAAGHLPSMSWEHLDLTKLEDGFVLGFP
jgi:hypothetical protein